MGLGADVDGYRKPRPEGVRNLDHPARSDYAIPAAINKGQYKTQKKTGRLREDETEQRTNE
jgi:hypothetical protein